VFVFWVVFDLVLWCVFMLLLVKFHVVSGDLTMILGSNSANGAGVGFAHTFTSKNALEACLARVRISPGLPSLKHEFILFWSWDSRISLSICCFNATLSWCS